MAFKVSTIRTLYFYSISLIGLVMITFSAADLINLGLKTWVFPNTQDYTYVCSAYAPSTVDSAEKTTPQFDKRCEADQARARRSNRRANQSAAIRDFSFLLVGIPLFIFHFKTAQKERREELEEKQ